MATGKQIQRIYALGDQCGLLDRGLGTDDNLHLWIKQWSKLAQISPSETEVHERLRGLICKVTGREIKSDGDIFYRVTRDEAVQIIETLKRMIRSEERKKKRGEKNADV